MARIPLGGSRDGNGHTDSWRTIWAVGQSGSRVKLEHELAWWHEHFEGCDEGWRFWQFPNMEIPLHIEEEFGSNM